VRIKTSTVGDGPDRNGAHHGGKPVSCLALGHIAEFSKKKQRGWRVHRGFEETGIMYDTMIRPKNEAHIEFRAEMDCLVAVIACPESGRGQAIRAEIFDK
jgi:uncharacterized protein YcgI (DUF1989 family)